MSSFSSSEADLNAAGSNVSSTLAASWAGWAVSSLASKFYRTKSTTDSLSKSGSPQNTGSSSTESSDKTKSDADRSQTPTIQKSESGESAPDFDEEVWGSIDDQNTQSDSNRKSLDGWDDELGDNDFDDNEINDDHNEVKAKDPVKTEDQDFFDKFTNPETNAKTSYTSNNWTKSQVKRRDSFGNDDRVVANSVTGVSSDDQTKKVEQRRQMRSKENEERKARRTTKGPMKLGAQKLA